MPHGHHIYAKSSDMESSTMCTYTQSYHAWPHWEFLLRCCAKCPSINITDQEIDDQYSNTSPSIRFHIDYLITRCTTHGRLPLTDKKICRKCKQDTVSDQFTKIYTRKELVMMDTTASNFHTSFYIPLIHHLVFHIPHVQILGTNHCGDSFQTAFKRCESFQDVLSRRYYDELVVASFAHKIQPEYYSGNRSVYIEGISLEHFSALPQTEINSSTKPCTRHAVFHYFSLII